MAASDSLRLVALPLRTLAFGAIGGTFTFVGVVAGDSIYILKVDNTTNQDLIGSLFGAQDDFYLPSMSGMIIDVTANKTNNAQGLFFPANVRFAVRHQGVAPTSGTVAVTYMVGD